MAELSRDLAMNPSKPYHDSTKNLPPSPCSDSGGASLHKSIQPLLEKLQTANHVLA